MNLKRINKPLLFTCLVITSACWALPSDHDKPTYIQADQVQYQQKTGATIYRGHVKFDQGTSHLLADLLTIYKDPRSSKIQKMIAQGNLAQYSTLPKEGGKVMHASAKTIQYDPVNNVVLLLGDALITQEGNSFRGQHIEYNVIKQTVISAPSPNSKTTIIIQPGGLQ
jgi:lipopolysaccharide export system protein LptA